MSRRTALLLAAAVPFAALLAWPLAFAGDDDRIAPREALVELGRRLFFDPSVGRQGRIGCSSCHDPEHGFSDARKLSTDESGDLPRHSQPLTDLAGEGFHWDGEFDTVRDVIDARVLPGVAPVKAAAERALRRVRDAAAHGVRPDRHAVDRAVVRARSVAPPYYATARAPSSVPSIASRLAGGGRYDAGFRAAFGDAAATPARIGDALEAYVATLATTESPFDRFVAGEDGALSAAAKRGHALFTGRAACAQCHVAEGRRPAFTDGKFHNTGLEWTRIRAELSQAGAAAAEDPGRLDATFRYDDCNSFKTPSLRDVARRAPYFHDASAATLADVVRYYDKVSPDFVNGLDPRLRPLSLTEGEVADLVAFLESLTGDERPGLGRATPLRSQRLTIRTEWLDGSPVKGMRVVVQPSGDRLAGAAARPAKFEAVSGADGVATVEMPATTHFVVSAEGVEPTELLPDWTSEVRLVFTPSDRTVLRVRFAAAMPAAPRRICWSESLRAQLRQFAEAPAAEPRMFQLVRELGSAEALYVLIDPPGDADERAVPLGQLAGPLPELRPGRQSLVDLRADAEPAADATALAEISKLADAIAAGASRRQ